MNRITYLSIASLALLTACAPPKAPQVSELETNPKPLTTTPNTEQTQEQAQVLSTTKSTATPSSFELSGAIAAKNHKKGWTATLNWIQKSPNQYQIRLIGPLGGQTVIIEKQNSVITYREGAKKLSSTNGDDLLQKQTGIRLPVNSLYYWVRGLPAPGNVQSATRNATNQLTSLNQAGYHIEYTQYMSVGNMTLPSKIRLQGHDVMIKLVVKHWNAL